MVLLEETLKSCKGDPEDLGQIVKEKLREKGYFFLDEFVKVEPNMEFSNELTEIVKLDFSNPNLIEDLIKRSIGEA